MLQFAPILAILIVFFLFLYHLRGYYSSNCDPLFIDWPIVGMLPRVLWNLWDIHNFAARILNSKSTGHFKGPWFTGMYYLVTSDPMNVYHTMGNKNFSNYVKGFRLRDMEIPQTTPPFSVQEHKIREFSGEYRSEQGGQVSTSASSTRGKPRLTCGFTRCVQSFQF